MVRQWRIDRFNGIEFLVCEVYFKHTWSKSENDAFELYLNSNPKTKETRSDFRVLLDEWLDKEHEKGETFYGLSEPIPVIETIPHIVVRGAVVNNRVASIAVDYMDSVTPHEVLDSVARMYHFTSSPHWRNTVATQISNYGSLFATEDDS